MITLHHLNRSRSKRIIALLEELQLEYQIEAYQRDATTSLAPPELLKVHPLGKSPVIELNGKVIAESGAIVEYLIERFGADQLAPEKQSDSYPEYLQWIHFAESSAMVPLLLTLFISKEPAKTEFLANYANSETQKVVSYLNDSLANKRYLVDDRLTGADFMMSFVVDALASVGVLAHFPHIEQYGKQLASHRSFQRAAELEQQHG